MSFRDICVWRMHCSTHASYDVGLNEPSVNASPTDTFSPIKSAPAEQKQMIRHVNKTKKRSEIFLRALYIEAGKARRACQLRVRGRCKPPEIFGAF